MVSGIVALLDAVHTREVELIWQEFQYEFGVHGVAKTPIPHFSFHLAERYDAPLLAETIAQVTLDLAPLRVRTSGLGLFTGEAPTLYIPVVKSLALSAFHARLWEALEPLAVGSQFYYHPDHWLPHITLAQCNEDNFRPLQIPQLVGMLAPRHPFAWEMEIAELAYLEDIDPDYPHQRSQRFPLRPA